MKGRNDLKTTHPNIAEEWSKQNFPLQPDEVNAKSRKNVYSDMEKDKSYGGRSSSLLRYRSKEAEKDDRIRRLSVCPLERNKAFNKKAAAR